MVVSCMADDMGGGEAVGGSGEGGEEDETLCKGHADCVWGERKEGGGFIEKEWKGTRRTRVRVESPKAED